MKENQDFLKLLDLNKIHTSVFERKFMYLSDIIDPIYRDYVIRLERVGYTLDLDVLRSKHHVENFLPMTKIIVAYLKQVLKNPKKGHIVISMNSAADSLADIRPVSNFITIKDDSSIITVEQREQYAILGAKVKSRLGFGTTIQIPISEPYDKL